MNLAFARSVSVLSLSFAAFGCASTNAQRHDHEHGEHHGEGGHHHEMAPGMKAFHDVLAPPYHMDAGPARSDLACTNVPAMKDAAGKIATEPKGDAAAWKAKADTLAKSVESLDAACAVAGRAGVGERLEAVHDAFHALMKHHEG